MSVSRVAPVDDSVADDDAPHADDAGGAVSRLPSVVRAVSLVAPSQDSKADDDDVPLPRRLGFRRQWSSNWSDMSRMSTFGRITGLGSPRDSRSDRSSNNRKESLTTTVGKVRQVDEVGPE